MWPFLFDLLNMKNFLLLYSFLKRVLETIQGWEQSPTKFFMIANQLGNEKCSNLHILHSKLSLSVLLRYGNKDGEF